MKHPALFSLLLFCLLWNTTSAQKPRNGTYTYKVEYAEWGGKSLGASCIIRIKGDSRIVVNNGTTSGKKGEIIDRGIIMKHAKTGLWLIGHSSKDKNAKDVGGCSDGPLVIDFKRKILELC